MLSNGHAAGRNDKCDSGRDIERVVSVTARPAYVDGPLGRFYRDHALAHRSRGGGDFRGCLAALGQRHEERRDFLVRARAIQHCGECIMRFLRRKWLGGVWKDGHGSGPFFYRQPSNLHEIGQHVMTMLSGNALGVELDAVDRQFLVAKTHHRTILARRVDSQALRDILDD